MSKLEKEEVARVKTWCEKSGVLFIKFNPFGSRGWPDTVIVFPGGVHLWVEFKRKGKVPRKLQLHRMSQLEAMGAIVAWFDNAEDCIEELKACLKDAIEALKK